MSVKYPKDDKKTLSLVIQPEGFFHELVTNATVHYDIRIQPETEFYLVNLLKQFMTTERLYQRDDKGSLKEEPLALMAKEAIEHPEPQGQARLFRNLGDVSLYTAGFFQESLNRKLVDVDYYIEMGEKAYHQVAVRTSEEILKNICSELAEKFATFVDVLAEVSDATTPRTEKNLLRIYEVWVRTKSERAEKTLKEAGIIPNSTIKKNLQ